MKNRVGLFITGLTAAVCICGCSDTGSEKSAQTQGTASSSKPTVYSVNYPLQYCAKRIAGDFADVHLPVPPDVDPAFWKPHAEIVTAYQNADLILLNGATYAKWVPKVSLPTSKLVNTSEGFRDQYIALEEAVTHSHGPGGEHAHAGTAFTTWLDLSLAIKQAEAIKEAFIRAWPAKKSLFEENYTALESDLLSLDQDIKTIVAKSAEQPLVASHPVYQYFTRCYELNIEAVHWEPDEVPDEKKWGELEHILEDHPAKWMIWEGEPLPSSVERLRSIGVGSVVFDPCGNVPDDRDFVGVMRRNVENLKTVFE